MLSKNGNGSLSLIPETLGAQDSDTGLCVVIDESPDSSPSPETSGKGNHRGKTDVQLILFSKGNEGVDECPIHLTPGALEKSQDHLELHRDFYNLDDDVMHMIDHFHHREASSSAALTCASSSNALNSQQKMPAQKGKPVLHQTLASMISSASTMTRMSLRLATFSIDAVFTSLKYSAHFGFGMSRKTLVSAVSVARNLHWLAIHQGADSG